MQIRLLHVLTVIFLWFWMIYPFALLSSFHAEVEILDLSHISDIWCGFLHLSMISFKERKHGKRVEKVLYVEKFFWKSSSDYVWFDNPTSNSRILALKQLDHAIATTGKNFFFQSYSIHRGITGEFLYLKLSIPLISSLVESDIIF